MSSPNDELSHASLPLVADYLVFSYRRGVPVVRDVTHCFEAGSMTAITGPSGKGKSTLLYILSGLLRPNSGTVWSHDISLYTVAESVRCRVRAQRFSFIFQDAALNPRRSVLDAIREPCIYAGASLSTARSRALGLMHRLGVEVAPDARPREISGGQAQRIGVCRALMLHPEVIFADEPTGNLDSGSATAVLDALHEAARDGTVVLVATHDDRVLSRCDQRLDLA